MVVQSSSMERAAAFRRRALSLAKAISMGLKSGEYGGRKSGLAPVLWIASRMPETLWAGRLSMMTMSPGRS